MGYTVDRRHVICGSRSDMALVKRDELIAVGEAPVSMLSHEAVLRRITGQDEVVLHIVRYPVRHPRRSYKLLTKTNLQNPDPNARPSATTHRGVRNEIPLTLPGAAAPSHGANGGTTTGGLLGPLDESIIRREVDAPLGYGAYTPNPGQRQRGASGPSLGYVDSSMRAADSSMRAGWSPANIDVNVRAKISPIRALSVGGIPESPEDEDEVEPDAGEQLFPHLPYTHTRPHTCNHPPPTCCNLCSCGGRELIPTLCPTPVVGVLRPRAPA